MIKSDSKAHGFPGSGINSHAACLNSPVCPVSRTVLKPLNTFFKTRFTFDAIRKIGPINKN